MRPCRRVITPPLFLNFQPTMSNTHTVNVTETLDRQVEVEADSMQDAIEKVQKQYNNEEIVLDWSDHVGTDIVRGE